MVVLNVNDTSEKSVLSASTSADMSVAGADAEGAGHAMCVTSSPPTIRTPACANHCRDHSAVLSVPSSINYESEKCQV